MDQDFDEVVMKCNNCQLEFYAAELHTHPESNLLMCVNCLSLPGSRINILKDRPLKKKEVKEPSILGMTVSNKKEQVSKVAITPGYTHYHCTNCRYEFQRKNGFSGPCPYCCKKGISAVRAN